MAKGRDLQALVVVGQVKKLIGVVEDFEREFAADKIVSHEIASKFFVNLIEACKVLMTRWPAE
jgi:hypothetical protein